MRISQIEKDVLFRKYKSLGLNSDNIKIRLDRINRQMIELNNRLRKKHKSDEYIQNKFMEEFNKLINN